MLLWQLLRRETAAQLGTTWFRVGTIGVVLLSVLVARAGLEDSRIRAEQRDQFRQQREAAQARSEGRLSGLALETGLRVLHEPAEGSQLVLGLSDTIPSYWDFSPAGVIRGPTSLSVARDAEVGSVFDFEALVRIVLGLLALLLGVHTVGGQRASGTLTALLSQPVSRETIAISKLLATSLSLAVVLAISSITAWLVLSGQATDDAPSLALLAALQLASLSYLVVMIAVGMVIGALVRSFSTALIVGVSTWVYIAFVAPQVFALGARVLAPVPTAHHTELERQKVFDSRLRTSQITVGARFPELARPESTAIDFIPAPPVRSEIERLWTREAQQTRRIVGEIDDRLRRGLAQQDRLLAWLSVANPGNAFLNTAMNLADTGRRSRRRWEERVASHQERLNSLLFDSAPRLMLLVPVDRGGAWVGFDRRPFPTADQIGLFTSPTLSVVDRAKESSPDILVLAAYLLAGIVSAVAVFPRPELS